MSASSGSAAAAAASSSHKRPREDIVPGSLNAVIYQATRDWLESQGRVEVTAEAAAAAPNAADAAAAAHVAAVLAESDDDESDVGSDDDEPQFSYALPRKKQKQPETDSESDDDEPLSKRVKKAAESDSSSDSDSGSNSDSELDIDVDSLINEATLSACNWGDKVAMFKITKPRGIYNLLVVPMIHLHSFVVINKELELLAHGKGSSFFQGRRVKPSRITLSMRSSKHFGNYVDFLYYRAVRRQFEDCKGAYFPAYPVVFFATVNEKIK